MYWWKSSKCPQSKFISHEIIPKSQWVVVSPSSFTACHEQKHTNLKNNQAWVDSLTNRSTFFKAWTMELLYRNYGKWRKRPHYSTEIRPKLLISHTTSVGMTLTIVSILFIIVILATETSGYNSRTTSSKAMSLSG
mgnify:FL=1